jgi:hypothetical protein
MGQQPVDVGLLAEALIYYDRVLLVPSSFPSSGKVWPKDQPTPPTNRHPEEPVEARPPFIELLNWFSARQELSEFLALLADGTVTVYHYAFTTLPMLHPNGNYSVWNAHDSEEAEQPTFIKRVVGHRSLYDVVPKARHRQKLYRVLQDKVVERKSDQFERAVENARRDISDEVASVRVVQAFVDQVRSFLPENFPERIVATAVERTPERTRITYNVNFNELGKYFAPRLDFSEATPLIGLAQSNRTLWSAALEYADLYLPAPLSVISSLKLAEGNERRMQHHYLVQTLEREVEFPDIRRLVNEGALSFREVLVIRRHARSFRAWLQTRAERDSNALWAYHNEVAVAAGLTRAGRKVLRMFGALVGPASALGAQSVGLSLLEAGVIGTVTAGLAPPLVEKGVDYVFDLASKLDQEWKPVVFGDWAKQYVHDNTTTNELPRHLDLRAADHRSAP